MACQDYTGFRSFVQSVIDTNDLSNFKSENVFCDILEHKHCPWGQTFYKILRDETTVSDEELLTFCNQNDVIGNPQRQSYPFGTVSSNSIKYVYHANLVLKHMKSLGITEAPVVEIGGGYGGMAFAMNHFAPNYGITITDYYLLDFPELCKLQELYLKQVCNASSKFHYHSTFDFGDDILTHNLYLIGIYSLGELTPTLKHKYIETLFPKVDHGFLIWNSPPYIPFQKQEIITPEIPLTGPHNSFIYF